MSQRLQISLIGGASCDGRLAEVARKVGRELARAGATLVCGGRGGVMAAASRGAREAGGTVVGILPGPDASTSQPNEDVGVAVYTGMGQGRNLAVVLSGAAAIAVGGGWGTLSEIALALKHGIPVVTLESWSLERPDGAAEPRLRHARTAREAVELALGLADRKRLGTSKPIKESEE